MTAAYRNGTRILLGDSNETTIAEMCHLLESWGYTVDVARSGTDVLTCLGRPDAPEIVMLDNSLVGLSAFDVFHRLRQTEARKRLWTMLLTETVNQQLVQRAVDAGVDDLVMRPLQELDLRVRLSTAERMRILQDELQHSMERARFYDTHDKLTGVLNRETVLQTLFRETDRVQRMHTPLGFMLIDLDDFSKVNSQISFEAGDRVLQQTVERLQRYLRSYDIVGRMGEDEFLIGLPGCNKDDTSNLADRLRKLIFHKPFDLGFRTVNVTASFGLAQSRGRTPLVVLREAEQALVHSKAMGKNYIYRWGDKVSDPLPSPLVEEGPEPDATATETVA
jgi:diguanylate cyclase (GGDEF)-like protein